MRAKEEAFRILEAALSVASTGVEEAEVALGGGELGVTAFADNQIRPALEQTKEILSVRVAVRGRLARVESSDLSLAGIREAAQQARVRAEHLPDAAAGAGLPDPQTYDVTEAYDPEAEGLRSLDRAGIAGKAIIAAHKHGMLASGLIAVRRGAIDVLGRPGLYAVANTRGLLAYHAETRITCRVRMRRADGATGWAEDESFAVSGLDPEDLVRTALQRAQVGGTPRGLPGKVSHLILEPPALAELLSWLGKTIGGRAAESGQSFLSHLQGEMVAAPHIHLSDDASHAYHRGTPFDDEGVARKKVAIIEAGRAQKPIYGWASAKKRGADATGHLIRKGAFGETEAATHLVLQGGDTPLGDLLRAVESGILVGRLGPTELLDPRRLLIRGTTQESSFIVEGGQPAAPLAPSGFTVSLLDILSRIEKLTRATWAGGSVVPAVLLRSPFA